MFSQKFFQIQCQEANFQNFPRGMPPDPLAGAYQVCLHTMQSYLAQHLINFHF